MVVRSKVNPLPIFCRQQTRPVFTGVSPIFPGWQVNTKLSSEHYINLRLTASLVTLLRTRSIPLPRHLIRCIKLFLPPLNFISLHYAYFIGVCLITSVIFWGAATPFRSVSYTDSLFFTVSAMTLAGLNTVNLSTLNSFQQVLLFTLIVLGSAVGFYES